MDSKYKYLIKNTSVLTISNFSSKLLTFFMIPLYTGVLTPTEYGIYDLVASSVSLLLPILTLNIIDGVMRFFMDNTFKKEDVASVGLRYITIGCLVFTGIVLTISYFQLIPEINGLEFYIIAYMFSSAFCQFFTQMAKGYERILDMGIAGIIGTIASLTLNVYLLLYVKMGFRGFFISSIIASFLQIVYYAVKLKVWYLFKLTKLSGRVSKNMICYSTPLIFTVLGWWANNATDKYIVMLFCGVASNGLLAVSYKIPTIINTVQSIFIQAWQISAIKEIENGDAFYKQMFGYYNVLMCLTCSVIIIMTRPLACFLFAKDFYSAWQYVPLLLVCSVINGAAGFIGPILTARKETKTMAKSAFYGVLANVLLNLIFTYFYGIQGAVFATVTSSYVIYITRKRAIGKLIESPNYKACMVCWLLLIVQCFVEFYLKNYPIQLFILLTIAILLRHLITKVLANLKSNFKANFAILV